MKSSRVIIQLAFIGLMSVIHYEGATAIRDITHEDIRDAILSLVHIFRDNTDKLERHEYRERQLGEQLKKAFGNVDKKQKMSEDTINSTFSLLQSIDTRLRIMEMNAHHTEVQIEQSGIYEQNFNYIKRKIENIEKIVTQNQLSSDFKKIILEQTNTIAQQFLVLRTEVKVISDQINEPSATQSATLSIDTLKDVETKILSAIRPALSNLEESYGYLVHALQNYSDSSTLSTNDILRTIKSMPVKDDIVELVNVTKNSIEEVKYDILLNSEKSVFRLQEKVEKMQENLFEQQQDISKSMNDTVVTLGQWYETIQNNDVQIMNEVKSLSNVQQVLIQTADNVLDTKRRIEYGTHQILLEVGDLVKQQAKEMNTTINRRFDGISSTILDNQNGGLTNLSSKIEMEISQVWRQIGIMYQTLTASANALDRLQHQTEIYVNGSLSTMDNMENKVGQITGRMTEVDDNLNYLLGRLSLVTQEFNQIKTGLGDALDNIRSSFHTVQEKVKDVGPGPKPIEEDASDVNGMTFNQLKNTAYVAN